MTTNNFFKRFFAIFLAAVMLLGMIPTAFATETETGIQTEKKSNIIVDKYADGLDEDDRTNVTLEVPGDYSDLGVDIIYILGSFLSKDQVESNVMISCLIDTFAELIAAGVPVNFGMVPFSSTKNPVMPLTTIKTEADLAALPDKIAAAIAAAGDVYDQVNMENALLTAKEMFSTSELGKLGRTDRQHLVLLSSGHTYYFNSGDNNEYISTVPVHFTNGSLDTNEIFYMEKAWMRARNNSTNSYPIPKSIIDVYNANKDKYESEWDCYWTFIDMWAKADVAAGDTIVYEATTREAGDFKTWMNSGKYSSNTGSNGKGGTFTYSGYGAVITNPSAEDVNAMVKLDMANDTSRDCKSGVSGPNPFKDPAAAHAISYERAMWEAYNFAQENIVDAGIGFYPVYVPLRADGSASNGSTKYYDWTDKYIGHCFMNMLAGGEAVTYSATDDKAFFAPIKSQILYTTSIGSYVEDFIGYEEGKGNFEFIQNPEYVTLKVGGVTYVTAQVETKEGADFSLSFTKPDAEKATFWLDYYYGNGTTTEKFIWTFGENVSVANKAALTYKLQLTEKAEVPGEYTVITNISAILYPRDSEGIDGDPVVFPIPDVKYPVLPISVTGSKTWADEDDRDGIRPESITINLLANGEKIDSKTVTEADGWTWTFENLQKTSGYVDIVYTVTEEAVEGYEAVIDGLNVTNTHAPERVEVSGSKTWADEDNADGIRPESIIINLLANGEVIDTKTVTEADDWAWTFENLYKYENGEEIEYTITENAVEGYETVVDGYNVTNTHEAEKITVNGTKTWVDEDNADGIRPESITINLLANGEVIDTKVVTEADGWAWTFENLYKYEGGVEIVYTITEDAVEGYETVVDGYNVTNTHEVEDEIVPPAEDEEDEEIDDPEIPRVPADKKPEEKPEVKPEAKPEVTEKEEEIVEIEDEEIPLAPEFTAPQTGDTSSLFTWLAVAVVTGTLFIIANTKMRRAADER